MVTDLWSPIRVPSRKDEQPRKVDLELVPLEATSWWREDGYGTVEEDAESEEEEEEGEEEGEEEEEEESGAEGEE